MDDSESRKPTPEEAMTQGPFFAAVDALVEGSAQLRRARTAQCLPFSQFERLVKGDCSEEEEERHYQHILTCAYCMNALKLFRREMGQAAQREMQPEPTAPAMGFVGRTGRWSAARFVVRHATQWSAVAAVVALVVWAWNREARHRTSAQQWQRQQDGMTAQLQAERRSAAALREDLNKQKQKNHAMETRNQSLAQELRRAQAGQPPSGVSLTMTVTEPGGELRLWRQGNQVWVGRAVDPTLAAAVQEKTTRGLVSDKRIRDPLLARLPSEWREEQRTRSGSEKRAIVLLEPVATGVLSTTPTLRWTVPDVTGEFSVRVDEVRDADGRWESVRERVVEGRSAANHFTVPTPLRRGKVYSWQVTAGQGAEQAKSLIGYFKVIDGQALAAVQKAQSAHAHSHLLLGAFYESHGLYLDAQREFAQLAALNPHNDRVGRMRDALDEKLGRKASKEGKSP